MPILTFLGLSCGRFPHSKTAETRDAQPGTVSSPGRLGRRLRKYSDTKESFVQKKEKEKKWKKDLSTQTK